MAQRLKGLKKILVVLNSAWNIYNFRLPLMRFLREQGYDVIAIAPKDGYEEYIKKEGFEFHEIELSPKGVNPFADIRTIFQLYKLYKNLSPLCVLHYTIKPNIYGSLSAKMAGAHSISTVTGLGALFISEGITSKIGRFLYRAAFKFPKKIFFQNNDDRMLFDAIGIAPSDKTGIIPGSGIDTVKFSLPDSLEGKDTTRPFIFLLIARMLWDKGIGEYVEAAKIMRSKAINAEFWLLGGLNVQNPAAISKEQMVQWQTDGVVRYFEPTDDVKSFIASSDCVVLPSYREGLPRTLLEAASMQKPIIATDAPGCKEVVMQGVNGFLCKIKDADDLADAMVRMTQLGEPQRVGMGQAGRHRVETEFSQDAVNRIYFDFIKQLDNR